MRNVLLTASAALLLAMGACSSSPHPKSEGDKAQLDAAVSSSMTNFTGADKGLQAELDKAAGYAIMPDAGKGGFIIGGAYGSGEVFEKKDLIGFCSISEGTIGAQIGGQSYSELIIFKDKYALDSFKKGEFAFAANASAVAIKPGAAAAANYSNGVAVFIWVKGGLMAEASIGGQKLKFTPK
jgi:lipid-binding SYLF domain-containing protein